MNKNKQKIYYYLYETTNIENGKIYIGIHKTSNLRDGYIGCGIRNQNDAIRKSKKVNSPFIKAVVKYGYDSFIKKVLYHFDSVEEMIQKEKEIVTKKHIKQKNNYNVQVGGNGFNSVDIKEYELKDYKGNMYRGSNIKDFCRNNKLSYSDICKLVKKEIKSSQGFYNIDYVFTGEKEYVIVDIVKNKKYKTDNLAKWAKEFAPETIYNNKDTKLAQILSDKNSIQIIDKRWWVCYEKDWKGYVEVNLNNMTNVIEYTIKNNKGESFIFNNVRDFCKKSGDTVSTMYGFLNGRNSYSKYTIINKKFIFKGSNKEGTKIFLKE